MRGYELTGIGFLICESDSSSPLAGGLLLLLVGHLLERLSLETELGLPLSENTFSYYSVINIGITIAKKFVMLKLNLFCNANAWCCQK